MTISEVSPGIVKWGTCHISTGCSQTQYRKALGQMGKCLSHPQCAGTAKLSMEIQKVASPEKKWKQWWQSGARSTWGSGAKEMPFQSCHSVFKPRGGCRQGPEDWTEHIPLRWGSQTFTLDSSILSFHIICILNLLVIDLLGNSRIFYDDLRGKASCHSLRIQRSAFTKWQGNQLPWQHSVWTLWNVVPMEKFFRTRAQFIVTWVHNIFFLVFIRGF